MDISIEIFSILNRNMIQTAWKCYKLCFESSIIFSHLLIQGHRSVCTRNQCHQNENTAYSSEKSSL
jgi:hypothetical protein